MALLLNKAPEWNLERSQKIVLWHGCTEHDRIGIDHNGINLSFSRVDLDFGRGFYTTTLKRQAEHWAVRRMTSRSVKQLNNFPVVLRFEVDRFQLASLSCLYFVLGGYDNLDYWSLVQRCRQSRGAKLNDHYGPIVEGSHHWFDIVSGPVVADWRQKAVLQDMDQVSFHTANATKLLNDLIMSPNKEKYSWQKITL